jgi:hypothetical protein
MLEAASVATVRIVAGALLLGACHPRGDAPRLEASAPSPSSAAAPSSAVSTPTCAGLFAPPPGAQPLCDEHVMGNGAEIHWRSFGVAEPRAAVAERLRALLVSCPAASLVQEAPRFAIALGNARLETFEASDPSYPTCAMSPRPSTPTVVLVSEMHARP